MATITLPPQLARAMTEQAKRRGTTLEALALERLNADFLPALPQNAGANNEGETMADFLREFIGSLDSRELVPEGADMSGFSGRELGAILAKKHREGRL